MSDTEVNSKFINRIDELKRSWMRKMVLGAAFAVPTVVSFSMNGLAVDEAHAASYGANSTIF